MTSDLGDECSRLQQATVMALRQRYAAVFGEYPPRTGNKTWLRRRILWRLQALAQGDLTERAKRQAVQSLLNNLDLISELRFDVSQSPQIAARHLWVT